MRFRPAAIHGSPLWSWGPGRSVQHVARPVVRGRGSLALRRRATAGAMRVSTACSARPRWSARVRCLAEPREPKTSLRLRRQARPARPCWPACASAGIATHQTGKSLRMRIFLGTIRVAHWRKAVKCVNGFGARTAGADAGCALSCLVFVASRWLARMIAPHLVACLHSSCLPSTLFCGRRTWRTSFSFARAFCR